VIANVPPSMRPTYRICHPPTLPHLPPHLKGAPPQEAGLTRNLIVKTYERLVGLVRPRSV
jgi:hypothetical protein